MGSLYGFYSDEESRGMIASVSEAYQVPIFDKRRPPETLLTKYKSQVMKMQTQPKPNKKALKVNRTYIRNQLRPYDTRNSFMCKTQNPSLQNSLEYADQNLAPYLVPSE